MNRRFLQVLACPVLVMLFFFGPRFSLPGDVHRPPAEKGIFELENHLRFLLRRGNWNPMISLDWRFEHEDFSLGYHALTAGAYYRIHRNLKAGLFYRGGRGFRHDDDWISDGNAGFLWGDTSRRLEQVLIADLSPRFQLRFLPEPMGENWVFHLKNRYHYNTFNGHQVLLIRPGLTWFHLVDREPLLNLGLHYAGYFSLNFGDTALYTAYPYLTVLYHLNRTAKLEGSAGYRSTAWSTSKAVRDDPLHGDYTRKNRRFFFRGGIILFQDR